MKKLLLLLTLFSSSALFAFSIGRDGTPVTIENISWQPVKYVDSDVGFTALLPGSPSSGFASGDVYVYSIYDEVHYEINCSMGGRYSPLATEALFVNQIVAANAGAKVTSVPVNQPNIKYIVDIVSEGSMVRLFCSTNQLYWAIVEGSDLSLATTFFDSIKITK